MNTKTYELNTGLEVLDKPGSLDDLALQIRKASGEALRHAHEATKDALNAGRLLTEAKNQIPHGEWETWVTSNCAVALRTAQAYMRLFKSFKSLDSANTQRVALLPLRHAMNAISTSPSSQIKRPDIRLTRPTGVDKAIAIFSSAERALKNSRRLIGAKAVVKSDQVIGLRKKLNAVLAELDALEVASASTAGGAA